MAGRDPRLKPIGYSEASTLWPVHVTDFQTKSRLMFVLYYSPSLTNLVVVLPFPILLIKSLSYTHTTLGWPHASGYRDHCQ
jgi:hypothetical protein